MNKKSTYNQSISRDAEKIIRNYRLFVQSNKEEVLDTLLKKIEEKEKQEKQIKSGVQWLRVAGVSVAASIALLIAFWFFTAGTTISTDSSETVVYRLPDDSRVILHDGSAVSFPKYFWTRKVRLTGEAYFEVVKGNRFRVVTSRGDVEVLGTRFLVEDKNDRLHVQCFQGSVRTHFDKQKWLLEPGMQFTGQNHAAEKTALEDRPEYPDFAKFKRSFSNVPLTTVVKEIEDFFGVKIRLEGIKGKSFSGTIQSGNLDHVLQIVSQSLMLNYRFEDRLSVVMMN